MCVCVCDHAYHLGGQGRGGLHNEIVEEGKERRGGREGNLGLSGRGNPGPRHTAQRPALPCRDRDRGPDSQLLLLLQLAGLSLEALQLLLGLLELVGGALQLPGQLLVGESQLAVLSLGFMLVAMKSCTLAFQLQRGDREEG